MYIYTYLPSCTSAEDVSVYILMFSRVSGAASIPRRPLACNLTKVPVMPSKVAVLIVEGARAELSAFLAFKIGWMASHRLQSCDVSLHAKGLRRIAPKLKKRERESVCV